MTSGARTGIRRHVAKMGLAPRRVHHHADRGLKRRLYRQVGRFEQARVRRRRERRRRAATVARVARLQVGEHSGQVDGGAAALQLGMPAAGSRLELRPVSGGGEPRTLVQTDLRYGGIAWGGGGDLALVYESEWRSKRSVSWVLDPRTGEKRVLHDRDYEDRYTSPGSPMLRRTERGTYTLALVDGTHLLMSGAGASPEGDRPFLDLLDIESGETERLWRSEAPYFESVNSILSDAGDAPITRDNLRVLFSRESKTEPAQYSICSIGDGAARECIQITDFPHPYPSLKEYSKEILRYEREDGVTLTGTLYLPPGHDPARDGPLPTLLWAYPREYKSADAAAQMRGSPHTFSGIGNLSPLLFLSMGYAVLNGPSMPIIAKDGEDPETANDTYIEQLVSSAEAAVAELERRGVAKRGHIAVGGHSYGAHMSMSLLAHAGDLFSCAICRSGAYNR